MFGGSFGRPYARRGGVDVAFILLPLIAQHGVKAIVTIGAIALQFAIHEGLFGLPRLLGFPGGSLTAQCVLPWQVIHEVSTALSSGPTRLSRIVALLRPVLARLVRAQLLHADDLHLYYNCASLAWKGLTLEQRVGSVPFAIVLTALTVATPLVHVALAALAAAAGFTGWSHECAVGFSGVLYALKVILTAHETGHSVSAFGFAVPTRYAAWSELLVSYVLMPHSSFVGHLAGILTGTAGIVAWPFMSALIRRLSSALGSGRSGPASSTSSDGSGGFGAPRPRFYGSGTTAGYRRPTASGHGSSDGAARAFGSDVAGRRSGVPVPVADTSGDADLARRLQEVEDARSR